MADIQISGIPGVALPALDTLIETESALGVSNKNTLQEIKDLIDSTGIRLAAWNFAVEVADADPGTGYLRLNHADPSLATFIYISDFNAEGQDLSELIADLAVDSNIGMQQLDNIAKAALYDVSGAVVDATTYWKIPVDFKSVGGGGAFDASLLGLSFIPVGGGIVGTNEHDHIDFEDNLDTVYQTVYLTPIQITDVASNGISAVDYSAAPDDGVYDFAGNVENDSIAALNIYLDGLADALFVVVQTNVTLSRASTIRRTKNLS